MLCLFDKDIRVVSVRSGYSSNYNYETEKTSLAYGGPHKLTCQLSCKAGGLQKRRALKCLWHSEFHHIIERPFPTGGRFPIIGKSASFFVDKRSLLTIISPKSKKNKKKYTFLEKSCRKIWWNKKNVVSLHPHLRTMLVDLATISDWKVGWVAETTSLLNWRAGLPYRGFESPTFRKRSSRLRRWSIHLMVRIQDSQSWHRGSIPLSTTWLNKLNLLFKSIQVGKPMQTN